MFENITNFLKKIFKVGNQEENSSVAAKERLHLVLMQDRANVSADFLEMMKQEIIEVIKKYIEVDESAIDVSLTNKMNNDGTNTAPALYANIPIISIKENARKIETELANKKEEKEEEKEIPKKDDVEESKKEENQEEVDNKETEEKEISEKEKDDGDDIEKKEIESPKKEEAEQETESKNKTTVSKKSSTKKASSKKSIKK